MDSPSPVHFDAPGVQRAEERKPVQNDVANLSADELELAHLPPLAGVLDRLGQLGAVIEVRDLYGGRDNCVLHLILSVKTNHSSSLTYSQDNRK